MPLDQNYMVGRMADNDYLENAVTKNRILWEDLFPADQEFLSEKAEDVNNIFTYILDGEIYLGLELSPVALDAVLITAVNIRERLGNRRFKQIERFNKKLIAVEAHVTLFITDDGFKMERAYQAINEVKNREIVLFLENDDDYNMFGSVIRVRVGDGINSTARLPYNAIARIGKSFKYDIDPAYVRKILKRAIEKKDNTIYIVMDSFLSLSARLIEVTGDFISDGIGGFFKDLSEKIDGNLRLSTTLWQTHDKDGTYIKEYAPLLLLGNNYQEFNTGEDLNIKTIRSNIQNKYINPIADNAVGMIQYLKSQENISRFIGRRLDGIMDFIKEIPDLIEDLLHDALDFLKTSFEFFNALLVGIINSVVDLLKSIVDILQLIFVFSGFVISEQGKRALHPISTLSGTMELLENGLETLRKTFQKANFEAFIDFMKALFSKGKEIAVIVYQKVLSVGDLQIFPSDVGYYLGYIVGWIAQEVAIFLATAGGGTIAKGLQGVIKSYTELISLARNVTVRTAKAVGKAFTLSIDTLVNLFKKIREIAGDIPSYLKMVDGFVDDLIKGLSKTNNKGRSISTYSKLAKVEDIANDTVAVGIKSFEKVIKLSKKENAMLFDDLGNPLVELIEGTSDYFILKLKTVRTAIKKLRDTGQRIDSLTLTHNHPPPGASLSFEDIYLALRYNIKKFRAVNPNGSVFELTRTGKIGFLNDTQLNRFKKDVFDEIKNNFPFLEKGSTEYELEKADIAIKAISKTHNYRHFKI